MRRCDVWWADLPAPAGKRPVVLLSRNEAYTIRQLVTVAPVTTRIRSIPTEVPLGREDGLPKRCVINVDTITTIISIFTGTTNKRHCCGNDRCV